MLFLSESEVQRLIDFDGAIEAVERAFRDLATGLAANLPRHRVRSESSLLHLMGAASRSSGLLAYKAYATTRSASTFHVGVYSADTAQPLALLEADWLGRVRTGAASAVATRHMARKDARVLGVIGAGKQAETQILAINRVRQLDAILVYCRTPERRTTFANRLAQNHGLPVQAVDSARAAAADADILVTVTTSTTPVFQADWIPKGCHINAVGSNAIQRCEIDPAILERVACLAIDSVEQAQHEAGDLLGAIAKGTLSWDNVVPLELIVAGQHPGRTSDDDITLFESLGIGLEDLAVAELVLRRWHETLARD